ncbi:alpha/beta fold hydrolase [Pseudonocardia sp. HH130630-07]|uniref:alpha/beta fold hydrolase n=1 Tax=Pseudonocardia sp. HH130630-07 TaxID=1690815 RepID=UPI000814EEE0|nr:alpha/beta hydrolase [Pseudonocardia sp. HH130630-07]ANY09401.1 hypothetical protein AFB00_27730 [Pseudonocardia sp. HH130630-07]
MSTRSLRLSDGRELVWDEHGPADGIPVVYLHGAPSCRVMGRGLASAAAGTGVRLIVPDRPGCGLSTFLPDRRIIDWPADVSALAEHLGLDRYRVVGTSGGGPYALACAAAGDPGVVRTAVVCGVGPLDGPQRIAGLHEVNRAVFAAATEGIDALTPIVERLVAGGAAAAVPGDLLPREDRENIAAHPELAADAAAMLRAATVHGLHGVVHDTWLLVRPWGFELSEVGGPVDFYAGDHDRNVPLQHVVDQAAAVPGSTLTVWPGSGHSHALTRLPEVLRRICAEP